MMKKRLIALLCAAAAATGMAVTGMAAEEEYGVSYKPVHYSDFDTLTSDQAGGKGYKGLFGSVTTMTDGLTIVDVPTPAGKPEEYDLSVDPEAEDKAIELELGEKGKYPRIEVEFPNAALAEKTKFSFNFMIPSRQKANYSILALDIRNGNNARNLFNIRGSNDEYRIYPDGGNNNTYQAVGTIKVGEWYHAEFIIDAENNVYDFYLNEELLGEALPFQLDNQNIAFNKFRFGTANNPNNGSDLKDTSYILDDIFVGTVAEAPLPMFLSTENTLGETQYEQTEIDTDLSKINVQFPEAMDPAGFEGNVKLVRGADQVEVAFEGTYDEATNVYTATILDQVMPCMDYTLQFSKNIRTAEWVLLNCEDEITISTKTVPFAVVDGYFTESADSTEPLAAIPAGATSVYANVTSVVTDLLEAPQELTVLVFCYDKGELKQVWLENAAVESAGAGVAEETVQIEIPLDGLEVSADTQFEISVWDSYMNMLPLAKSVAVQGE